MVQTQQEDPARSQISAQTKGPSSSDVGCLGLERVPFTLDRKFVGTRSRFLVLVAFSAEKPEVHFSGKCSNRAATRARDKGQTWAFYSDDLILAVFTKSPHFFVSACRKRVKSSGVLPRCLRAERRQLVDGGLLLQRRADRHAQAVDDCLRLALGAKCR